MGRVKASRRRVVATYTILVLWAFFCLAPLYWVFSTSIKSPTEATTWPPSLIPHSVTLNNYIDIFTRSRTFGFPPFMNSAIYGIGTVIATLVLCSLSGYAFSRYRFRGRTALMFAILFLNMLPGLAKIIPLYVMYIRYGLYDTRIGLIMLYTVAEIPLGTWLMKGYFDTIPKETEEAALVDGASVFQSFRHVTLPLALPGLGAVAVVAFNGAWNEYLTALILTRSAAIRPYTVALGAFAAEYGQVDWNYVAAAAVVSMLPIILLFTVFQRYFITGLGAGAVKG
jgi:multiple sugar transport system permease protein